jgi:predicted MPP superfamily phosphohydrolase
MTSAAQEPESAAAAADVVDHHRNAPARRRARVSRFMRVLLLITAGIHVPVALGVGELLRRVGAPYPWLLGALWGALGFALFLGRARAGMHDSRGRHPLLVRAVDIPYFVHWCAAVWTLIPAVVVTLGAPVVDLLRGVPVALPLGAYMWTYLAGLVVCGYGVLVRRRWFRVVEREVRLEGLPRAFDGLRIAHLSDLHVGTLTPKAWGMRWAAAANAREPDIAVVTGDLVTSGTEFAEDVAEGIGALRAKDGVYTSLGNHDYFGAEHEIIKAVAARSRVLRNEGLVIERGGAKLWLAAIDDTWTRRDDLRAAMAGRPQGAPTVLLAHDPSRFDAAAEAGANLVLSGHTHGGQIAFPFLSRVLSLASLAHPYNVGFYRRGRSTLYVHPGLGTTGPPMRLGAAPEVTILVLRSPA